MTILGSRFKTSQGTRFFWPIQNFFFAVLLKRSLPLIWVFLLSEYGPRVYTARSDSSTIFLYYSNGVEWDQIQSGTGYSCTQVLYCCNKTTKNQALHEVDYLSYFLSLINLVTTRHVVKGGHEGGDRPPPPWAYFCINLFISLVISK